MKSTLVITLLVAAGYLSPATAIHAQSTRLQASIPFAFSSGGTNMPAGVYQVSRIEQTPFISVTDHQNHQAMLLGRAEPATANKGNVLLFRKYGNQYFLGAIHSQLGGAPNVQLPVSKAEKRARRQTEEAGLRVEDPILVAMN